MADRLPTCPRCGMPPADHVRWAQPAPEGSPCIVRCPDANKWTPRGPDAAECSTIRERAAAGIADRPAECWQHGPVPDEGADVDALADATHAGQFGGWEPDDGPESPADPVAYAELRDTVRALAAAQADADADRWCEALAGGPYAVRAMIDSDRAPLYFRIRLGTPGPLGILPPAPLTRWTWTTAAHYVRSFAQGTREARRLRERAQAVREARDLRDLFPLPAIIRAVCPNGCACHIFDAAGSIDYRNRYAHCPTCR